MTGISSRSVFQTGCGLAAMSGPIAVHRARAAIPVLAAASPSVVSKVSAISLLRSDLKDVVDGLHERRIV